MQLLFAWWLETWPFWRENKQQIYPPGTQMTPCFGLEFRPCFVLDWPSKIEVSWVLSGYTESDPFKLIGFESSNTHNPSMWGSLVAECMVSFSREKMNASFGKQGVLVTMINTKRSTRIANTRWPTVSSMQHNSFHFSTVKTNSARKFRRKKRRKRQAATSWGDAITVHPGQVDAGERPPGSSNHLVDRSNGVFQLFFD